jgi:hypothetical protein
MGDVCPGATETWTFQTALVGITQHLAVQVLVNKGSVDATLTLPDGTEVPLTSGTPFETLSGAATFSIVVMGASEQLADYRVQVCRTALESCVVSDAVTPKPGDVDCSGRIEARDALLLLQREARLIETVPCPSVVQVNLDNSIGNPVDAELILQFVAGLIPELLPGF